MFTERDVIDGMVMKGVMDWLGKVLYAISLLVGLAVGGVAKATVFFEFIETSVAPQGARISASGWLAITDEAYAAGLNLRNGHGYSSSLAAPNNTASLTYLDRHYWWTDFGIVWFDFRVNVFASAPSLQTIAPMYRAYSDPYGTEGPSWLVNLFSDPLGIPEGIIAFNTTGNDFRFSLSQSESSGEYNSDLGPLECYELPKCSFTGQFVMSNKDFRIPEPGTLSLFGVALLGCIFAVRRSRPGQAPAS